MKRSFALSLLLSASLINARLLAFGASESTAPEVIQNIEPAIEEIKKGTLAKKNATGKLARDLQSRGFLEKQLMDGAAFIARKWDIFSPRNAGPYLYAFYAINQTLWVSVWKPKFGSDEEVMKKRLIPIVQDTQQPPRLRLFHLQIINDYLIDAKNNRRAISDDLAGSAVDAAYSIGTSGDEALSAYAIRVVAGWGRGSRREEFLSQALDHVNPSIQDAAAHEVAFFGASQEALDKVLALFETTPDLANPRRRGLIRVIDLMALNATRIPLAQRKKTIRRILHRFETTKSNSDRDELENLILIVGANLPDQDKAEFRAELKALREKSAEETRVRLDKIFQGLDSRAENQRKYGRKK